MGAMERRFKAIGNILVNEAHLASAFFSFCVTFTTIAAVTSTEWISITPTPGANNTEFVLLLMPHVVKCRSLSPADFFRPSHQIAFLDTDGNIHQIFRSATKVVIDCITPTIANVFYFLIAFCFVIIITSFGAGFINARQPVNGFLMWLRRNTFLEMASMCFCLLTGAVTIVAESLVQELNTGARVDVSTGLFMVTLCGLFSFLAAVCSLRYSYLDSVSPPSNEPDVQTQ